MATDKLPKLEPYIERATQLLDETLELISKHEHQQNAAENRQANEKPPEQMLTALAQRTAQKIAARKRHVKDKWLLLRDVAATSMTAVALSTVPAIVPHGQNRTSTADYTRVSSQRESADPTRDSYVPLSRYLPLTSKEYAEVHRELVTRDGKVERPSTATGEQDGRESDKLTTTGNTRHVTDDTVAHAFKMLSDAVSLVDWNKRAREGGADGGRLSQRAQAAALLTANNGTDGVVTVRRIGCYTRDAANNAFCTYQAMDGTRFELPCPSGAATPEMMPYEIRLFNARIRKRALDDTRDQRYEQLWRSKRRQFLRAAETIKHTLLERTQQKAGKKATRYFNPFAQINEFIGHHRDELKYNRETYDADLFEDEEQMDQEDDNVIDYFTSTKQAYDIAGYSPPSNRRYFWRRTHRIKSRRRWRNMFSTNLPVQRQRAGRANAAMLKQHQLAIMAAANKPLGWRHPLHVKKYDENFGFDEQQAAAHRLVQQPIDYTGDVMYAQVPTRGLAGQRFPPLAAGGGGENDYTSRRRLSPRFRRILPEVDRSLVNIVAMCEMRRKGERIIDVSDREMPFFRRTAPHELKQVDRIFKVQAQQHQRGGSYDPALFAGHINQTLTVQTLESPFLMVTGRPATSEERQKKLNLRQLLYHRYFEDNSADKEMNYLFKGAGYNRNDCTPSNVLLMDDDRSMKLFMKMLNRDFSPDDEESAHSTTSLHSSGSQSAAAQSARLMGRFAGEIGNNKDPLRLADSTHCGSGFNRAGDGHELNESDTDNETLGDSDQMNFKLPHDSLDEELSDFDNDQQQQDDNLQPLNEFMNMTADEQQLLLHKTPEKMPVIKRCYSLFNLQPQFRTTVPYADGSMPREFISLRRSRSAPAVLRNDLLSNAYSREARQGLALMQLIRAADRHASMQQSATRVRNMLFKPHPADQLSHYAVDQRQFDALKQKALTQSSVALQTNRYARLQVLEVLCLWKEVAHIAYFEKTKTLFELGRYQEAWSTLTEAIHTNNCNSGEGNFGGLVAAFIYRALLEDTRLPERAFLDAMIGISLVNSSWKPLQYLRASVLLLLVRHYMLIDAEEPEKNSFRYALRAISQIFDLNFTSIHLHKAAASLRYQLNDEKNDLIAADHLTTILERFDLCDLHVLLALVQVHWRQQKYALAQKNIMRALHIAPHLPLVYLMAALLSETIADDKPPAPAGVWDDVQSKKPASQRGETQADRLYANFCRIEYTQTNLCSAAAVYILARRRRWTTTIRAVYRMHPSDVTFNYRLLYLIGKIRYEQRRWPECVNVLEHSLAIFDKCLSGNDAQLLTMRSKLSYLLALAYLHINNGSSINSGGEGENDVDEKAKQCLIAAVNLDEETALAKNNANRNEHALRLLLILRWHWCQYQDDDEAELLFDDAVAKFPNVFGYWYAHARFYISQRRYARAVSNLSEALRCEPYSVDAYYLRALLKMLSRAMPQALEDLSMAVKIQPHNPRVRFLRGFVHHVQARLDDALDDYNKGALCVTTVNTRTLQVGDRKNYEQAYHGILHNRVLVYLKQRDYRRAAADLARLYLCLPNTWQYAYTLSYAWQKAGLLDLAQRLLQSAVKKFPSCSALWTSLGILHFTLQPFQDAVITKRCFQRAMFLSPLSLSARANLALFSLYEGRLWACANRAASIIQLAPTCPDGFHLRSLASFCAGYPVLALNDITQAIKLEPERESFMHRALMHLAMKDSPAAHADIKRSLKLSPEYAAGHYNLGNVYLYAHQQRAAMYHYRRAFAGAGQQHRHHWEARYNHLIALLLHEQYFEVIALVDDMMKHRRRSEIAVDADADDVAWSNNKWADAMRLLRVRALNLLWMKQIKRKTIAEKMLNEIQCVPDFKNQCRQLRPWLAF